MIQVYPRPDTETSTNARHRWAYYDGTNPIQYSIPIGVSFGAYPFVYTLQSGPAGMSIGQIYGSSNYGIITWTPTGSVSGATVQVLVTDQQLNTLTITWTVSTSSSTSHFIFVNSSAGSDSNAGTFALPFQTLSKAFGATFAATANAGAIVYLRNGTYTPPGYTDNDINVSHALFEMNTTTKPIALIGYPGETATLTMTGCMGAVGNNGADLFWQNLNPNGGNASEGNMRVVWMTGITGINRMTFDSISWTNATTGSDGSDNASMFHSGNGAGSLRQYLFLHACSESGRTSGTPGNNYAGCDLYAWQYALVQGFVTTPAGSVDGNIYFKGDEADSEMRECFTQQTNGGTACSVGFEQNLDPQRCLVRHNRCIMNAGGLYLGHDPPVNAFGVLWAVRNSVIGVYNALYANSGGGPYVFDSNFAQFSNTSICFPTGSFVQTDGLNQAIASGGLDSSTCLLIGASRTNYLGTVGAEIA